MLSRLTVRSRRCTTEACSSFRNGVHWLCWSVKGFKYYQCQDRYQHAHVQGAKFCLSSFVVCQHKNRQIWRFRHHSGQKVLSNIRMQWKTVFFLLLSTTSATNCDCISHTYRPHLAGPCADLISHVNVGEVYQAMKHMLEYSLIDIHHQALKHLCLVSVDSVCTSHDACM